MSCWPYHGDHLRGSGQERRGRVALGFDFIAFGAGGRRRTRAAGLHRAQPRPSTRARRRRCSGSRTTRVDMEKLGGDGARGFRRPKVEDPGDQRWTLLGSKRLDNICCKLLLRRRRAMRRRLDTGSRRKTSTRDPTPMHQRALFEDDVAETQSTATSKKLEAHAMRSKLASGSEGASALRSARDLIGNPHSRGDHHASAILAELLQAPDGGDQHLARCRVDVDEVVSPGRITT